MIQISPVKRDSAKIFLALAGQTGDGKTYSAIQIALGLSGMDASKVGLLDTENRRGSLYSDVLGKPFLIGDFTPPHSPARYVAALNEFAKTGIEVLVVDSMSHEHEGQGGLEEIANAPKPNGDARKVADWLTAKREHRKFMNALLHAPFHVIGCFRAREKTSFKDPTKPVSLGLQPITEKNVMFEATASFMLLNKGKEHEAIKLPEQLKHIFPESGYFTSEVGLALRNWLGGIDPIEKTKDILRLAAGQGTEAFKREWLALSKSDQRALAEFKDTLKDSAQAADDEINAIRNVTAPTRDEPLDPMQLPEEGEQ